MSITRDGLPKYAGESRVFAFDYQGFPEIQAGETISSATVTGTGLTVGTPTVTSADYNPGSGRPTIPSGKGVKVTISGGTASTNYLVSCAATTSGGSILVIEGYLRIEAAG